MSAKNDNDQESEENDYFPFFSPPVNEYEEGNEYDGSVTGTALMRDRKSGGNSSLLRHHTAASKGMTPIPLKAKLLTASNRL